jgi:hypothetical protein
LYASNQPFHLFQRDIDYESSVNKKSSSVRARRWGSLRTFL